MRTRLLDLETFGLDEATAWVDPLSAPSNYKDEAKITAYIAEAEAERRADFALDPDCCRIVALGWHDLHQREPLVEVCQSEQAEREALTIFWATYRTQATRIAGFNILRFDLPVLIMRSLYLGVEHPAMTIAPAWKSPHVDIWERLSLGGARKNVKSLRFYAKRLGIPIYDDISGKDVAAMVKAGEWEKVRNHCLFDLDLTRAVAERFGFLEQKWVPEDRRAYAEPF